MTDELVFIKLGGSLLTEKTVPFTLKFSEIVRIIKELKIALDTTTNLKLLVAHGGGSFPHPIAEKFKTDAGFIQANSRRGFGLCQNSASWLNRIIVDTMTKFAIDAISIPPSACCIADNGAISQFFLYPIEHALQHRIVPVPFGDCVFDISKGCTIISTEQLLTHIAKSLRPSRVLVFTLVGGVYTGDPLRCKDAKLIPTIDIKNFKAIEDKLEGSYAPDVTGGMLAKVNSLLTLAKIGIECEILSGKPEYIRRALTGERGLGTIIKPL
jgi:isopentenyl phosphate kinase